MYDPTPVTFEWIYTDHYCTIHRANVIGGWLIKALNNVESQITVAITFVPDPDHNWNVPKPT